jgi:ATP-dependent DNA ligase
MKIKKFCYFYPEKPRLVHIDQPLFSELSEYEHWIAERKYNGSRLQLHIAGDLQFWNRHGQKMDYQCTPEIGEAFSKIAGYTLFDGELRHNKVQGVRDKIILYDVFIWRDELLIDKPFWYRRNILEYLFPVNGEPVGITEQFHESFPALFDDVIRDQEIEGLVMKNTRGMLNLGRTGNQESNWMYKVRRPNNSYRF